MPFWPADEFWRLWIRAFIVIALGCAVVVHARPAHAALWKTSFYGAESGRLNADGSRFAPMGFTAAHRSLPFGTRLQACYRGCAVVVVRDRGPANWTGRLLDLSHGAARAIGLEAVGVGMVDVQIIGRDAPLMRARVSRRPHWHRVPHPRRAASRHHRHR